MKNVVIFSITYLKYPHFSLDILEKIIARDICLHL